MSLRLAGLALAVASAVFAAWAMWSLGKSYGIRMDLFDGHRLVTLRLRTSPEVKGRDREDYTFVFDADDLFVVRSIHYGEPPQDIVSDCQFEYDHPDGRPVLDHFCVSTP